MAYDGTTPLNKAVADLIECSPKNNNKLAKVIRQAKKDLGITGKARKLPTEINLQIYSHFVDIFSQDKPPTIENSCTPVEIISHTEALEQDKVQLVEIITQNNEPERPEIKTIQQTPVELFSQMNDFDNVRLAFYIVRKGKRERQVISLDGFFINALASIKVSKQDAPQWVQAQVDGWTAFDSQLPITRQVKYLIMREVVKGLGGSDDVFHTKIDD